MTEANQNLVKKKNNLKANLDLGIHNRFDIEVVDSKTGEIKKKAYAENVICQTLWESIALNYAYFRYINFGTGSGTPSTSDIELFTALGVKTAVLDTSDNDTERGIYYVRKKIVLSDTEFNGSVLTEVGVSYSYGNTSYISDRLCTHAMIKDMNGNGITIAKTDTDIINIYATIYVHYNPNGYGNGYIKFISEQIPILNRLAGESVPSIYCDLVSNNRYTTQNKQGVTVTTANNKMTWTTRIKVGDYNNVGGLTQVQIGGLLIDVGGEWYEGTNIVGESVGTGDGETTDFYTKFLFPSNASIYVDGVLSDAIVDSITPTCKNGNVSSWALKRIDPASTPENIIYVDGDPVSTDGVFYCTQINADGAYYYNEYHEDIGILEFLTFYHSYISTTSTRIKGSDNLVDWVTVNSTTSSSPDTHYLIQEEYRHFKFYKINTTYNGNNSTGGYARVLQTLNPPNIHFTTPPPQGAVITADYFTPTIAKDENHVFDLTVEITLNEYVPTEIEESIE